MGRAREGAALLTLVVSVATAVSGCTAPSVPAVAVDPAPTVAVAATTPPTPREPRTSSPPATAPDLAVARAFVAFAAEPRAGSATGVPWAPQVWFGLGENLFRSLARRDAVEASSWALDLDAYGRTGPIDVLQVLRAHLRAHGTEGLQVSVGTHPRCAAAAAAVPRALRHSRRIAIRPTPASAGSCLNWFAVDLYVDDAGQVQGVTLDLWEP